MSHVQLHSRRLEGNPLYLEMLEHRRLAEIEHERARHRSFMLCIVGFIFWTAVAVGVASWGMTTVRYAHHSLTIIEAGVLSGMAGIIVTLLYAYERLA